jgi:hypothetical protein
VPPGNADWSVGVLARRSTGEWNSQMPTPTTPTPTAAAPTTAAPAAAPLSTAGALDPLAAVLARAEAAEYERDRLRQLVDAQVDVIAGLREQVAGSHRLTEEIGMKVVEIDSLRDTLARIQGRLPMRAYLKARRVAARLRGGALAG